MSGGHERRPALLAPVERAGVVVHSVTAMAEFGVDAFVTGRDGGVSAPPFDTLNLGDHVGDDRSHVTENRSRVARAIGVDVGDLITTTQVHGATVVDAGAARRVEADAIRTSRPTVAVAVLVADCVPLLLVSPRRHELVVVHAGWRGLVAGVIPAALGSITADGDQVIAFVGPRISGEAYQVGPDVARHFTDVAGALVDDVGDRSRLDLAVVATHQLRVGGVTDADIHVSAEVTDGGTKFFSDRAMRPCGRFGLVARWRS